ncbi:hypothetical protein SPRG_01174 [Saprolegnia parasitica CBS 223.65]|uniref:Methylosome subunit pICln n=1 Tax=Saprolegnia parasitica (strain CBS 223.65) TaxID=695850 RepID=A0A067D7X7_SAPPC|nr:hypothetical protein SPRG_01174 [Saprolegnia parasitica CBS 223.65]KDO35107.1 hypothetical protein SPRG_01174 [Saprolegnia parasitica CBS 223.65]|eukprot:XP_012194756.1 hypothetical protein SPRG_01174 [Saprolegnia parasitica CBS 223.65]
MNTLHANDCGADGAPVLTADESILSVFPSIRMFFSEYDEEDEASVVAKGAGNLVVTTKRVVWITSQPGMAEVGYAWDMRYLSLHAISRDTSSFPEPCLYCHLDVEDDVQEVRFVPDDSSKTLQAMFDAFSASAALNPDDDEDDEEGEWIYNEDEVEAGAQMDIAAHLDSILTVSPAIAQAHGGVAGQFDDADEDDLL